jgi:hypothetical protein
VTVRRELSRDDIRALLAELGARLDAAGVEATIYIVGGAAMSLEFDVRRVTADVDAVFHPQTTVREQAQALAADRGLPGDWLNDSVRAFVPGDDADAIRYSVPGLSIALASARHLLAMKMAAFRPTDVSDLVVLFRELSIATPEEAADMALAVYGPNSMVLPDRDELLLSARAVIDRMRRSGQ